MKYIATLSSHKTIIPCGSDHICTFKTVEVEVNISEITSAVSAAVLKARAEHPGHNWYVTEIKQA